MDDKYESDKNDDVMLLPGFRFHPTDEELVGFYLKRKIQQRSLPIELIKQVDIYKHDPWDLPYVSSMGEKEWYFYCPRDRKYRNSARPNRVTGGGFWKATGTDRPIYCSSGTKCIGLKKSLVFYRGRAAKGLKTDWMMHEFRLPSLSDSAQQKKLLDKSIPANDSWAICKIFKKTNSMAQRALSHSWASDILTQATHSTQFSPENISCTTETGSTIQLCNNTDFQQPSSNSFSALDIPSYKHINPTVSNKPSPFAIPNQDLPNCFLFSPPDMSLIEDLSQMSEGIDYIGPEYQLNSFSIDSPQNMQASIDIVEDVTELRKIDSVTNVNNTWENRNIRAIGFPFSLSWDSPPCPSEISTSSTNNCST